MARRTVADSARGTVAPRPGSRPHNPGDRPPYAPAADRSARRAAWRSRPASYRGAASRSSSGSRPGGCQAGSVSRRRESSPPMLCPIRWTGCSPNSRSIWSPSRRARFSTAASGGNARHQDAVARRLHRLGDPTEIRRQGHRSHADPRKTTQSMGEHDRRVQPRKGHSRLHLVAVASSSIPAAGTQATTRNVSKADTNPPP